MDRPRPRLAPVTSARLPSSRKRSSVPIQPPAYWLIVLRMNTRRASIMHTPSDLLRHAAGLAILAAVVMASFTVRGADKQIVLIAGRPSHPAGMHEFRAGCLLFQKALAAVPGISVQVHDMGWPSKMVDG